VAKERNIRKDKPIPNTVNTLLADENKLALIREKAEEGASIGTIEAIIGMPKGRLRSWLSKGEANAKTPYRRLYNMYRSWAAIARASAELQQLAKSPGSWLEKNSSARLLEEPEAVQSTTLNTLNVQNTLQVSEQALLSALQVLIASGHSIDGAIARDQITLDHKPNLNDKDS
jgi:hypothetical protein